VSGINELITIYGRDEEFRRDLKALPFLKFPSHWYVQIIGPFAGAAIRFRVSLHPDGKDDVSIYADFHERLGFFGMPHWELYPDVEDNNARFALAEVNELFDAIEKSLKKGASNDQSE